MDDKGPKFLADGIPVWCACDRVGNIEEAIPNPLNPNEHPDSQIELLANIIKVQGWRAPITISKRSGFITKGHARLLAARLLGVNEIPLDFQDYKDEAAEHADLVADNRIAELAQKNLDKMKLLLKGMEGKIDLNLTGYGPDSLVLIMSDTIDDKDLGESTTKPGILGGSNDNDTSDYSDGGDEDYGEAYVIYLTFKTREKADEFLQTMGRGDRFKPGAKTIVLDMDAGPEL